ncbi:threonine/serine exporter family protein [Flavisolibacter tropicus]|uniref:threonine/serine exporter family protein n=1 Tax=Flavisolibacter tropicus TaxID=1492898 RepID=UPI00082D7EA2|nr:threonine/serine exporter family protein [Flavisolibacter tropicus]
MEEWINILFKAFWCGCAAVGFGILFNVPRKSLFAIWFGGVIVGLVKYSVLFFASSSVIVASFAASLILSVYCLIIANKHQEPEIIFAIPSVIPLVPGVFAYRTMLGLIKLSGSIGEDYALTLNETVHNGTITLFVIMAFTIGVIIPYQFEKELRKRTQSKLKASKN